jgi:hypothetical protein
MTIEPRVRALACLPLFSGIMILYTFTQLFKNVNIFISFEECITQRFENALCQLSSKISPVAIDNPDFIGSCEISLVEVKSSSNLPWFSQGSDFDNVVIPQIPQT